MNQNERALAQALLDVMKQAAETKPKGHVGVVNKLRDIFDTTIRQIAGGDLDLQRMIGEARSIQVAVYRRRTSDAQVASERRHKQIVIEGGKAQVVAPAIETVEEAEGPDPVATEVADGDLADLLDLSPAKFRDHFGGVPGLKVFAAETFGIQFDETEDDYKAVVQTLKETIKAKIDS